MSTTRKILIMGASYGSLLAIKLLHAGHTVKLICLPAEADLFNSEGAIVRMPIKGREGLVQIESKKLSGKLSAGGPQSANPADYDLVVLAMQEPQYGSPGVRELLDAVAKAKVPCMSIMNMPPLTYLARVPGVDTKACRNCYTAPEVWDNFDPALMTLCSPDPQAFRPPEEKVNVLQVRLPTNFKSARFDSDVHTALLRQLQADIEVVRFDTGSGLIELPVKLKVHESVFVPLAKWAMLIAGNYRCIQKDAMRPIKDAVHSEIAASREMFGWVVKLVVSLGADEKDLVPFEKYAAAAQGLANPSSAARALFGGAPNIERVDRLVQTVAAQKGMQSPVLDEVVALVDARLELNRKAKA
jgi:ketopantoate reductase